MAVAAIVLGCLVGYLTGLRDDARVTSRPSGSSTRGDVTEAPPTAFSSPEAPAPAASQTTRLHGSDEVQVCSGERVKTDADASIEQANFERAIYLHQVRAAMVSNLLASAEESSRIAGLLMDTMGRDEQHRAALLRLPTSCEGAECVAVQAAAVDVARVRETIASVGLASKDPEVYALALTVCNAERKGMCRLLNARHLARLDPGNAAPWLRVLQEARGRKDDVAQLEALHQIANARQNEAHALVLTGALLKAAPDDDRAADAVLVTGMAAFGVEVGWLMSGYQPLIELCAGDAVRDANRAQMCGQVADMLAERSDTVIGRNLGAALGRRLGWPAERLERMRGEFDAYTEASASQWTVSSSESGCARTRRGVERLRQMALIGEVGVMRAWVAASGKQPEDFVREARARRQQEMRAAQAAAATAAASAAD